MSIGVMAVSVVLGCALAGGLLLVATRVPRWAAPPLARRIAPYLRDIADPRGLTPLATPAWSAAAFRDRLARAVGGAQTLAARLRRAGWTIDPAAFRARQLVWTLAGIGGGALLAVAGALVGLTSPGAVLVPLLAGAAGAAAYDARLSTAVRRLVSRITDELPSVLEFLALCLAAGEGLRDAVRRVGDLGAGELTGELRGAVLASGTGSNLSDALTAAASAVDVPALSRAVDHLVAAIDRGAPLAQVLQDQATDAREEAGRALLESAGRKEILMLLPLVFLILPLSVLFAVFPGVVMLRLGMG